MSDSKSTKLTTTTARPPAKPPLVAGGGAVQAIIPRDIEQAFRLGGMVVAANMAPKGFGRDQNAVTVAILHGMEIGLTPMAALQSIAVINGMPTIWGDGALALVQGSGLLEDMEETPERDAQGNIVGFTCRLKRRDRDTPISRTFTMDDAMRARLSRKPGPWQDYPQRMLQMRARSWAMRDGFADVLKGFGIAEEVSDLKPLVEGVDGSYAPAPPRPKRSDYEDDQEVIERAADVSDNSGIAPDEALRLAREDVAVENDETQENGSAANASPAVEPGDGEPASATRAPVTVQLDDDGAPDWTQFGQDVANLIYQTGSVEDVNLLERSLAPALANMEIANKRWSDALRKRFDVRRAFHSQEPLKDAK